MSHENVNKSSTSDDDDTTAVEEIEDENERLFLSNIQLPKFSVDQLLTATDNFSYFSNIDEGGVGRVYKGKFPVAVKNLINKDSESKKQLLVEALVIPRLDHPNIINLIGCCTDDGHRMLVYELMPFRSLEYRLYGIQKMKRPNWIERMGIALGVAKALEYLHSKVRHAPIFFRDLKPSNILLDESFHPKISDFGIAIYGPESDYDEEDSSLFAETTVRGNPAYSAPEYRNGIMFTPKCDVYSFGLVLLELCTGHRPLDFSGTEKDNLADWVASKLENGGEDHYETAVSLACTRLTGQFQEDIFLSVINVGLMCTQEDPDLRPSMADVAVDMAKFIAQQESYDKERRANAGQVQPAAESNPKPQPEDKMGTSEYPGEGSKAQDSPDVNTNPDDAVEEGSDKGPQSN